MKKFLKFIFIVVIIFIVLFIINFCRNYFILRKIYNLGSEFDPTDNYHIQEKINTAFGNEVINYYYMDKKYLYIDKLDVAPAFSSEIDNSHTTFIFHNLDTDEYNEFSADENGELVPVNDPLKEDNSNYIDGLIFCNHYEFSDLLKKNIFKIIKEDSENYIINLYNQDEYVDKSNGLLSRIKSIENNIDLEETFEKGVVDEKTIDINQYYVQK